MIEVIKDLSKTPEASWRVKNTFAVTTYPNSDRANALPPSGSNAHWRQKPADVMCIRRYWTSINNIFKDIAHVITYPCNRKPHSPLQPAILPWSQEDAAIYLSPWSSPTFHYVFIGRHFYSEWTVHFPKLYPRRPGLNGNCSPSENMYFLISFKCDFDINWSECKISIN